jgi:hypothetical protein
MNTGLQDAVNLGWKLGAVLAALGAALAARLLPRRAIPVGQAVLALTGRQFWLNTARTARRRVVRWAAHRVIAPLPPVQDWLAATYSGVAIRYPPPGAGPAQDPALGPVHKLAGARLPRGTLDLAGGGTARLYGLFGEGRFALLEAAGQDGGTEAAPGGGTAWRGHHGRHGRGAPGPLPAVPGGPAPGRGAGPARWLHCLGIG